MVNSSFLNAIPKFEAWFYLILEARNCKVTFTKLSFSSHSTCDLASSSKYSKEVFRTENEAENMLLLFFLEVRVRRAFGFLGSSNTILVFGPSSLCRCWEIFILEAKEVCLGVNSCGWGSWCLACAWTLVLRPETSIWTVMFLILQHSVSVRFLFPCQVSSKKLFWVSLLEVQPRACSSGLFYSFA